MAGNFWYPTKLISETVRALKKTPLLLFLTLLNITILVLVYLATSDLKARHSEQMLALIKECFK